jgi:DNA polymerase (family 10)
VDDIRGDLHMHSTWSDGACSIEEMVAVARARGYEYVALTDHSGGIGVAHGLSPERLEEQHDELERVRASFPDIHIFWGTELEIKRDGSLDFPDEILNRLDWVVASVHSGFNQSEEEMTARIIRAIENPHVDAIGHPTGRLIGKRAPYAVDLEAVFRAAARTRTALEINSFPERLDLVDRHARRARDLGVMLTINTDAHAPVNFENIRYGVAMARRGWIEAGNVLNTFSLEKLKAWIRRDEP